MNEPEPAVPDLDRAAVLAESDGGGAGEELAGELPRPLLGVNAAGNWQVIVRAVARRRWGRRPRLRRSSMSLRETSLHRVRRHLVAGRVYGRVPAVTPRRVMLAAPIPADASSHPASTTPPTGTRTTHSGRRGMVAPGVHSRGPTRGPANRPSIMLAPGATRKCSTYRGPGVRSHFESSNRNVSHKPPEVPGTSRARVAVFVRVLGEQPSAIPMLEPRPPRRVNVTRNGARKSASSGCGSVGAVGMRGRVS